MIKVCTFIFISIFFLLGCAGGTPSPLKSSSVMANENSEGMMYKPVEYENSLKKGPVVVVLPGKIRTNNATFANKITSNNIADFAEMELGNDNFRVLEREDLGSILKEISLAANMGDVDSLNNFKKGKFKTTRWFLKFDVLRAEPVSKARRGFDGSFLGSIVNIASGANVGGAVAGATIGSASVSEASGLWIVGMRYKIIDARTSEQVGSGYFEDKMQIGASSGAFLGVSASKSQTITLDHLSQRLVQKCVQDIDKKYK